MKRAGGINDNRVDARLRFDESHSALDAEHEHDLGKGFAGQPIVRKNCHALYFAWRFAGRGVDQVMQLLASKELGPIRSAKRISKPAEK